MVEQFRIPFEGGPYLQAAMLCEQVLLETDGIKSAIRIIDRVTRTSVGTDPPREMEPFPESYKLLLKLKSGEARGLMPLELRLERPDGTATAPVEQTVYFEGDDDRGVDIVADMRIEFTVAGLYWIDVRLEGIRITRVPLRVIYLRQPIQRRRTDDTPPASPEKPPSET